VTTTPLLLLLAAAGANGLLTGASLDQSIKQLPARHRIGVLASARYGQAADLANGVAWYAALGVGTALLALVAADAGLAGQPSTAAAVALWVAIAATAAHSAATARRHPPTSANGAWGPTRRRSPPCSTASNAGRRSG